MSELSMGGETHEIPVAPKRSHRAAGTKRTTERVSAAATDNRNTVNGFSEANAPAAEAAGVGDQAPVMARAEDVMDQAGERLGHLLSAAGQQLHIVAGRAREASEDFWAEAQSIRDGWRAPHDE